MPDIERASYDQDHPVFQRLADDVKLWRYMDLTKLLSLLEDEALHFARLDKLSDPFEGSVPESMVAAEAELLNDYDGNPRPPDDEFRVFMESAIGQKREVRMSYRCWTWVSCWNRSDIESDLLWSRYNQPKTAIAIQSTFGRVGASFGSKVEASERRAQDRDVLRVFLGPVTYVDFKDAGREEPRSALLIPMLKREGFVKEDEVRAMITGAPTAGDWLEPTPIHRYVKVDLDTLIETIFVSPVSEDWFYDLVVKLCKRYGFDDRVKRSELSGVPLY